ncbi:hypothetical protein [Paenibacillus sp. GP183]|jgi:hypothetical protein|uniref:hypothetical protein n=1 Tax=Paenibacillus sp. GP183 TaxID=1882751 RepID=UPI00089A913D|nr:hypothetical protein [Paenibacillus sp. GP183]SEB42897.1 hypothetical protein SAMN05443246_0254 [Paenibacillus sp. GP183]
MELQRESLAVQTSDSPSLESYMAEFKKLELHVLAEKGAASRGDPENHAARSAFGD